MTPTLEACRARCARCQSQAIRACLRVNGVAICLRSCLTPIMKELEQVDAILWTETQ